MMWYFAREK